MKQHPATKPLQGDPVMKGLIGRHQLKEYYGGADNYFLDQFEKLTDDEIKKELIKIKGIGPWSAEMFLIFSLKRLDVFSVGDLGLRTAIEKLYGISRKDKKAILALAETWRPHRTLASRLLWASLEKV